MSNDDTDTTTHDADADCAGAIPAYCDFCAAALPDPAAEETCEVRCPGCGKTFRVQAPTEDCDPEPEASQP